jgi:hypothetical protein
MAEVEGAVAGNSSIKTASSAAHQTKAKQHARNKMHSRKAGGHYRLRAKDMQQKRGTN